jgi:tetratricopeptide (TPR) repeat protein
MDRPERRADNAQGFQGSSRAPDQTSSVTAAASYEAGVGHMHAGRHLEAQLCCREALAIDADHVATLHLMGLLALQARQYDHAIAWTARANQRDLNTDYLHSLGTALEQQGLHWEAFKAFDAGVQLKPADAELWGSHGNALANLGRTTEALSSYQRVLALDPKHADAAFRCGLLLLTLKRPEEALACFNRADELFPNHANVLGQRALALYELKRFEDALTDNRRAHALAPASAETCNNIGACLQWLRRDDEALPWFEKALALQPAFIRALINKASSLFQVRRIDEAAAVYRQVQAIDPGNADAAWNLSFVHLVTGDFEAGWAAREVRWNAHMRPAAYPHFAQPTWRGEADIDGKTILVFADEGFGDTIQYARYVPMLAARGARVVLAAQESLLPLLSGLPGVAQCVLRSASSLPAFDMHCAICSLPYAFGTRLDTIPAATPYLPPAPAARVQAWEAQLRERLGPDRKPRIGLSWAGNPRQMNDHNRSAPLHELLRLLDTGLDFVSLQKAASAGDQALLAQTGIADLTALLTDFTETAALASCLDLVISVDTSVAHLCGALGRPTWVMLSYMPDHRWLLDREDSPWYPTARLFRQSAARDWAEVIENVRRELARFKRGR